MTSKQYKGAVNKAIRDKMVCLDDFGICSKNDKEMRKKLEQAVAEKPNKDPREVLDYFCRSMIHAKINGWND